MWVSQQGGTDSAEPMPDIGYKKNEPLLEQYNLLPASTPFHVRYCWAQADLVHQVAGN